MLLAKLSKHQTQLCSGSSAVPWGSPAAQNCTFSLSASLITQVTYPALNFLLTKADLSLSRDLSASKAP